MKRNVLRRRLKVSAVGESIVSRGKSFQTVGARYLKDLLRNTVENRGQSRRSWLVDRRVRVGRSS